MSEPLMKHDPWTEAEMVRFSKRESMFVRRGLHKDRAEALAESLVYRDRDRDERRVCIECAHWQRAYPTKPAVCGAQTHRVIELIPDLLARCPHFDWQVPT